MESAEDLLRNKSIKELRVLVASLEASAASKRTELQLTVGSKYHEFIQSADAITDMYMKASNLEENLRNFCELSQTVVNRAHHMGLTADVGGHHEDMKRKNGNIVSSSSSNEKKFNQQIISSKYIWQLLDDCNVYDASQSIFLAEIIVDIHQKWSKDVVMDDILLKNCRSSLFLREVILEDCTLLTICNVGVSERAKIFAAKSLLSKSSHEQLLLVYLEDSKIKIVGHLDKLRQLVDSLHGDSLAVIDRTNIFNLMSDLLENLVIDIQITILGVFTLFFKLVRDSSGNQMNHVGYIKMFQTKLKSELSFKLNYLVDSFAMNNKISINKFIEDLSFMSIQEMDIKSSYDLVQSWLLQNIIEPSATCASLVLSSSSTSAEHISVLQKRLWNRICRLDSTLLPGYEQEDWFMACKELIVPLKYIPYGSGSVSSVSSLSPWETLWSLIFQAAFLAQVDRQVRESCSLVLCKTKLLIASALSVEGVILNTDTFQIMSDSVTISHSSGDQKNALFQKNFLRLQYTAESIRSAFELEVMSIAGSSIDPKPRNEKDIEPEGDSLFFMTVFMKLSQLLAHLLIFLREASVSIRDAASTLSVVSPDYISKVNNFIAADAFIGRFGWLLLSRGSFLNLLLSQKQDSGINKREANFGLSSVEQIISAFEIADTNGDGFVTYEEAEEAIQALAVSSSSYDTETKILSPSLTPRLSFDEFALVVIHLQSSQGHANTLNRVRNLLEKLVERIHEDIAEFIVNAGISSSQSLHIRYFGDKKSKLIVDSNVKIKPLDVKALWMYSTLPDEDGNIVENSTKVHVPSGASLSLLQFISYLMSSIGAFTSSGTVESLFSIQTMSTLESSWFLGDGNLVSFLKKKVMNRAIDVILTLYAMDGKKEENMTQPDESLQIMVDLMVTMEIMGSTSPLQVLLEAWKSKIDPVDAVLYIPVLEQIARTQVNASKILLSGDDQSSDQMDLHALKRWDGISNSAALPLKPSARFGLLALPFALTSSNSKGKDMSIGNMSSFSLSSTFKTSTMTTAAAGTVVGGKNVSFNQNKHTTGKSDKDHHGSGSSSNSNSNSNNGNSTTNTTTSTTGSSLMSSLGSFSNSFLGTK